MSLFTRREFIENVSKTAAAMAAASAPAIASDFRRAAGPNERLRIAIIGLKGRGDAHLKTYMKMKDVEIGALCDIDDGVLAGTSEFVEKQTQKRPATYKDMRKLFEDKTIDAVSVATCNHTHTLAGLWAVQAGKHAYVEKPISHNVWEGRKLVEAAKKYGKVVAHGTQCRSNTGMRKAMEYLHSGKIGKVKVARAFCYKKRGSIKIEPETQVPKGVDYDLWLGPAPERPFTKNRFHYNWHWMWDTGNGDLGNQGVHQMDIARWGVGKQELPKSASSLGGRFGYKDDGETPNTQIVVLDYGDTQIIFEVRGLPCDKYKAVEKDPGVLIGDIFECTEGVLVIPSYSSGIAYSPKGELLEKFGGGNDEAHFQNFIDAVRNNKPESLNATALDGHLSSALCHLGNVSYRVGTPKPLSTENPFGDNGPANETFKRMRDHLKEQNISLDTPMTVGPALSVDPKAETIADNAAASKLLTREYRKPFVVPENP